MRIYHRRSSATREKLQLQQNGLSPASALRLQVLGACGHRDSLNVPSRPRSQSLFPGSPNSLGVPARSRSASFSGPSRSIDPLTASQEEHIFQCYTRVMYIMLVGLAAAVLGLTVYGIRNFSTL
ncbi:hypothetical protein JTE90_018824 [Oedothorax gibbosus]|uniref:Uncharacterized protein n=1 Tax=Oedothorax gibbosus TaxID=931172 RepID=A0AAV6UVM1_9ARAC|nr:hypothetical protein JTE90_018824 [Oedothorax gibbosus]